MTYLKQKCRFFYEIYLNYTSGFQEFTKKPKLNKTFEQLEFPLDH
jgi:hypothetical protein